MIAPSVLSGGAVCSAAPRLSLQVVVDDWDRMSGNDFIGGAGIALGPMLREARPPDAEPSLVRRASSGTVARSSRIVRIGSTPPADDTTAAAASPRGDASAAPRLVRAAPALDQGGVGEGQAPATRVRARRLRPRRIARLGRALAPSVHTRQLQLHG